MLAYVVFETVSVEQLKVIAGGSDPTCGNFVELSAPDGTKAYYDPVGVISLTRPAKGEAAKTAKTAMRTQLGAFYSADTLEAIKAKLAKTCGADE